MDHLPDEIIQKIIKICIVNCFLNNEKYYRFYKVNKRIYYIYVGMKIPKFNFLKTKYITDFSHPDFLVYYKYIDAFKKRILSNIDRYYEDKFILGGYNMYRLHTLGSTEIEKYIIYDEKKYIDIVSYEKYIRWISLKLINYTMIMESCEGKYDKKNVFEYASKELKKTLEMVFYLPQSNYFK